MPQWIPDLAFWPSTVLSWGPAPAYLFGPVVKLEKRRFILSIHFELSCRVFSCQKIADFPCTAQDILSFQWKWLSKREKFEKNNVSFLASRARWYWNLYLILEISSLSTGRVHWHLLNIEGINWRPLERGLDSFDSYLPCHCQCDTYLQQIATLRLIKSVPHTTSQVVTPSLWGSPSTRILIHSASQEHPK